MKYSRDPANFNAAKLHDSFEKDDTDTAGRLILTSTTVYNSSVTSSRFPIFLVYCWSLSNSITDSYAKYSRPHKLNSFYDHRAKIKIVCLSVCLSVRLAEELVSQHSLVVVRHSLFYGGKTSITTRYLLSTNV